ncbi:MAG: hypothetical protein RIC35_21705 [Marinoscillum sp.]
MKVSYKLYFLLALIGCEFQNQEPQQTSLLLPKVTNVKIVDAGNANTPADLIISFHSNSSENVAEYRLIAVPMKLLGEISLTQVEQREISAYPLIEQNSSTENLRLGDSPANDILGNPMMEDSVYFGFILSVSASSGYQNTLSTPSNLFNYSSIANPVKNITVFDVGNANDPSDIKVTFNEPVNNLGIAEYRMFVTSADSDVSITELSSASTNQYYSLTPGKETYTIKLSDSFKAFDGTSLEEEIPLSTYILSVSDGDVAQHPALSLPSNFILKNDPFIMTVDTAFAGNGGIIISNSGLVLIGNLGSNLTNPTGDGLFSFNPATNQFRIISSTFPAGHGGSNYGVGKMLIIGADVPEIYEVDLSTHELNPYNIAYFNKIGIPTDIEEFSGSNSPGFISGSEGIFRIEIGGSGPGAFQKQIDNPVISYPINIEIGVSNECFVINHNSKELLYSPNVLTEGTLQPLLSLPSIIVSISYSSQRDRLYAITTGGRIYEINHTTKTYEAIGGSQGTIQDGKAINSGIRQPAYLAVSDQENRIYFTDRTVRDRSSQIVNLRYLEFPRE